MTRTYFSGLLAAGFLITTLFCGPVAAQSKKYMIDEVVAVVGNKMILLSDLKSAELNRKRTLGINPKLELSDKEKAETLNDLLVTKLLALNAIADSLPMSQVGIEVEVENRIQMLIQNAGSVKKLEEMMGIPLFQIKDALKMQSVEDNLARMMQQEIVGDVKITPLEVRKIAKTIPQDSIDIVPRQFVYAQILRNAPEGDAQVLAVKEELLEYRKRIMNGDSFSALARLYSDDGSASRGGEMDYAPLAGFDNRFADAVGALKPGQVSGIVESSYGFHLIQLIDVKENQYKVRHILRWPKFDGEQLNTAMLQLDSIAGEIKDGKITFADAAMKFSDDVSSRTNGGVLLNTIAGQRLGVRNKTERFFEDELRFDYSHLKTMNIGDISESFQTYDDRGRIVCKIVKLIDIIPEHKASIDDDYSMFEEIALNRKREEIFKNWIDEKIGKMYIRLEPPYDKMKFDFNWVR